MGFQIAIDGPGGSGKSTVAKLIAKTLGYTYIDTGAMYRAVGYYATEKGVSLSDEKAVTTILPNIDIDIQYDEKGGQQLVLNGDDVTEKLRSREMGMAASAVAAYGAVRERLVTLQRQLAEQTNIVMDGRDIATHVLPNADLKIYLDASIKVRAERRCQELAQLNLPYDFDTIVLEISKRDENDKNRAISPLRQDKDSIYIDTSDMTLDEEVKAILCQLHI